ncbi:hypothetical protein [Liquorilactobacillus oeni]|uniref:HTH luxR-type domain-containing protein n=1 Tax=Liquorilactobacillus oeni DSM 19972 TaxID=1423777 RepID=A0A0R1MKM6_9LACO|nr:hypothetical protein [Liquorilactobacillus oeni]KRL05123.1 hypothetical protein FD46_GL001069 [Liquorilactobacillus oeni DSM 19972]
MTKEDKQSELIANMADLFNKISAYNMPIVKQKLAGLTFSEIEIIELIANINDAHITKLAKKYHMPREAISKITKNASKKAN